MNSRVYQPMRPTIGMSGTFTIPDTKGKPALPRRVLRALEAAAEALENVMLAIALDARPNADLVSKALDKVNASLEEN